VLRGIPRFPDLSFSEFMTLANEYFNEFDMIESDASEANRRPGYYTTNFVLYFFQNPKLAYPNIDEEYCRRKRWQDDMFQIVFLNTETLNRDLSNFLASKNFNKQSLERIKKMPPVRPAEELRPRPMRDYRSYYSQELKQFVLRKERLIFEMFPFLSADFDPTGDQPSLVDK
jgi:hypothetical protein